MNLNNPYGLPPPTITLRWLVDPRGLGDALNPLDHPWNFDTATVAKSRLRAIVRIDREAFPVSRWVATNRYSAKHGEPRVILSREMVFGASMPIRHKRHYRWERRQ